MEISIKAASDTFKISRNTIYEKMKSGQLSRTSNGKLEISELLRVFGNPSDRYTRKEKTEQIEKIKNELSEEHKLKTQLNTLSVEQELFYRNRITTLEEQLKKSNEREDWQRKHIEALTETIKLLEPPKVKKGFFRRLFGG